MASHILISCICIYLIYSLVGNCQKTCLYLISAGLNTGLYRQVRLRGVDGEFADGTLGHLEAATVMNVSDWREKNP